MICVTAKKAKDKEYYERNKEKVKAKVKEYREVNSDKVAETNKRWREANADKLREQQRAYHEAHRDEIIARVGEWRKANPDRVHEQRARHRDKFREKRRIQALERYYRLMAEDPERIRKARRDWVKTQKGVLYNRAARMARRGAPYTEEALSWIASLVDPICFYCGRIANEIDHIIPVSRGGTGERSNLVPSCRSCNARKNAMGLENFLAQLEQEGRWPLTR